MIDLTELRRLHEEATIDKADLFDFYHKYWDGLLDELAALRRAADDALICLTDLQRDGAVASPFVAKIVAKLEQALNPKETP